MQKIKLPIDLQKWIKEYEKIGDRGEFVWKQVFYHSEMLTFSTNPRFLQNTKFLMFMFIILLDDVVDKMHDAKLLDEILKIPFEKNYIEFDRLNQKEKKYLKFTQKVWQTIEKRIKRCFRYKEFKEILRYDVKQLSDGMRYSYLVNKKSYLINKTECSVYLFCSVCSMQALVDFTFDFMCSPNFIIQKFGKIREIVWRAQEMTRYGNWISSWKNEIKDKDFANGVFAYAIDLGIITINDLKGKDKLAIVKKIENSEIEKNFLKKWEDDYHEINKINKKIGGAYIKKYLSGLEKLLILVLSTKHFKN